MALSDGVVVEVVARRDLDATRAEGQIDIIVGDHRNRAAGQGQHHVLADQRCIALVAWVDRHCNVAQHRLGPRSRHHERTAAVLEGVADLPDLSVLLLAVDLEIGNGGAEHGIPVDQPFAAVDQAFFVEPDEDFDHGTRHVRVHGEIAGLLPLGVGEIPVA